VHEPDHLAASNSDESSGEEALEPEHELAVSVSDELSGKEASELEDGHVHGYIADKSPDPELDRDQDDDETNPFEDMLDRALPVMDDQVRFPYDVHE
jgi:hypothetical protein